MTTEEAAPAETPSSDRTTKEVIFDALLAAAIAHGVYEAEVLGGVHDEVWPDWYADHMVKALADEGYALVCK